MCVFNILYGFWLLSDLQFLVVIESISRIFNIEYCTDICAFLCMFNEKVDCQPSKLLSFLCEYHI